jgi:hypothetical protein
MSEELREATGRMRLHIARVDPEDEFSLDWIGINKPCSAIPAGALSLIDNHHYHDDSPKNDLGHYCRLEWAYQADWFRPETHWRGWIPLAKEDDRREGAWAMIPDLNLPLAGPTHRGLWQLNTGS